MFLRRATQTCAAVWDPALNASGFFQVRVTANRPWNVTPTLRNGHTSLSHRSVCVPAGGVDSTLLQVGKRQSNPGPVQTWDSPSGFTITNWAHLDRVSTIAASLSKSVGGGAHIFRRRLHADWACGSRRAADSAGDVLSIGSFSGPRCSTMQTRASSTAPATATQKRDPDAAEERTDVNKGVKRNESNRVRCLVLPPVG